MHLAGVHAIAAVSPLITMVLAALLLGERIGPHRKAAAAIGFAGVLLIVRPGAGVFEGAALWPLLGAFLWGLYRSEEHTSELQSLTPHSYAVFCLKKQKHENHANNRTF